MVVCIKVINSLSKTVFTTRIACASLCHKNCQYGRSVGKISKRDQSLSGRWLKIVNSSLFGCLDR